MSVIIYRAPFLWYLGRKRGCDRCKKKLIVSRQPIFVNLNSNTMKNTVQRYGFFLTCQEFAPCFLLRLTYFINSGLISPYFGYFFITISQ